MKKSTLNAARKEFERLKNKLKIPDLTYILQEDSTNEHLEPKFYFQISGFSTRLAPISFFSNDEEDLVKQFKETLRKLQFDEIEIAWLEAMQQEHEKLAQQAAENAKNARNRLLVEGSTNDIREPIGDPAAEPEGE